jgi:hypothetical protein
LYIPHENIFHYLSNNINFIFCILMIFDKNLVKLDIVWLSEKNIGLKPWDGGSKFDSSGHFAMDDWIMFWHSFLK